MKYYEVGSIVFKNGKWIRNPEEYDFPFEYADTGCPVRINGESIVDHIQWFHNEDDAIYRRAGLPYLYTRSLRALKYRIEWMLGLKRRVGYWAEVGVYEKDDVAVYIFRRCGDGRLVSFYKDASDNYIWLSEGNCCNPVLGSIIEENNDEHIIKFIVDEVYRYCYENVLTWICDVVYDFSRDESEYKNALDTLRGVFGRYN